MKKEDLISNLKKKNELICIVNEHDIFGKDNKVRLADGIYKYNIEIFFENDLGAASRKVIGIIENKQNSYWENEPPLEKSTMLKVLDRHKGKPIFFARETKNGVSGAIYDQINNDTVKHRDVIWMEDEQGEIKEFTVKYEKKNKE